jgi:soluble lytic murein transglycosylase-like protein
LLAALSVASGFARPTQADPLLRAPARYRGIIERAASKHGVNAALVAAVIHVESAFQPRAVSRKGAQGLMQLMPDTAARFGVRDAFDPEQNVSAGTRYLARLLGVFGDDVTLACAAYNAGPNVVRRYGGVPPYRETQHYVARIRRLLARSGIHLPAPAGAQGAEAEPPKKPGDIFYVWHDRKGILNVSQEPPTDGSTYSLLRPR